MGAGEPDSVNMGSMLREQARRAKARQDRRAREESFARYAEALLASGDDAEPTRLFEFVAELLGATVGHQQLTLSFTDGSFRQYSQSIGPMGPEELEAFAASVAERRERRRSGRLERETRG
jgi:hypothetical protein